ncbi:hypothetical protein GVD51_002425 [Salmonella enterica subsp. enterica serovar Agona]|nr:hypothetical protein [Salmonella enterica subsp. enterica serovar Agona]EDT0268999.1 hypothetical protein [Salmonella enterica]EDY2347164.1 hypothetical protein [Salmonella enterica subsp. enterica serovar Agona]EDY5589720.1 hypothetical protein [Salmonella enterica subsp. enterica serovar Agona]EEH0220730.1 hypothetical protein [Salmonella enterica subsp. enterica serovar Agona]
MTIIKKDWMFIQMKNTLFAYLNDLPFESVARHHWVPPRPIIWRYNKCLL